MTSSSGRKRWVRKEQPLLSRMAHHTNLESVEQKHPTSTKRARTQPKNRLERYVFPPIFNVQAYTFRGMVDLAVWRFSVLVLSLHLFQLPHYWKPKRP